MLGMVEHGDGPRYVHMTGNVHDSFWRLRWLPRDDWSARASDTSVIDTVHVLLQQPSDGKNRLRKTDVLNASGPHVRALFLHCASALTSADVLGLVQRCPNLSTLSLSECHVDDALLHGIAASACAPRLAGLRLWLNRGKISPAGLGALLTACSARLTWLDIELAFMDERGGPAKGLDHAAWLAPLRSCAELRVALLPGGLPPTGLGELATGAAAKLELLSVERAGPECAPLSALEPFATRLAALDLHGFALDAAASDAVCAAANRLTVGSYRMNAADLPLPRVRLLKCSRIAELHLAGCALSVGDVEGCLARLPQLRALHVQGVSDAGVDPAVLGAFDALTRLCVLNLSSCLRNYYEHGEEVATANVDNLLIMAEGLDSLVQLDLSSHHDAFYATVEGEYCPYDSLCTMACKMSSLRVLNLSENGRKFAWGRLRGEMRCLNEDIDDDERGVGVTIYFGDEVTVYAAGTPEAGEGGKPSNCNGDDSDSYEGDRMIGEYYDDDDDDDEW